MADVPQDGDQIAAPSMRQEEMQAFVRVQEGPGGAAKDRLRHPGMAEGAGHEKGGIKALGGLEQCRSRLGAGHLMYVVSRTPLALR